MDELIKLVEELKTKVSQLTDYVTNNKPNLKLSVLAQNPEMKDYDRYKNSSTPFDEKS